MTTLRLVADDLTGALDTAAEFVPLTGPVQAFWDGARTATLTGHAALDLGTREADRAAAVAAMQGAMPALAGAGIAFKKIDSLLRGQTLPELAACVAAGPWACTLLAPAFPFQGRITRSAQQLMASGGGFIPVGPNLVDALRALGIPAQAASGLDLAQLAPGSGPARVAPGSGLARVASGSGLAPGVTVFDAQTDAELDAVVAAAGGIGAPVLWCGTGGLARALAGGGHVTPPELPRPVLGLFGSDQAVTAAQLAACLPHWTPVADGGAGSAAGLAARLERHGIALATHALPEGTARAAAASRIAATFRDLVARLPAPGTLVVAGGETLRGLCLALGATSLEVRGRLLPGVPVSVLRGGAWDGVTVVSKSGAFGHPTLLRDVLRLAPLERTAS